MASSNNHENHPLWKMPLLETHAHLNGSIPQWAVDELVRRKIGLPGYEDLQKFKLPTDFSTFRILDFFPLFGKFIYRLTDDESSILFATESVLDYFEAEGCVYLELRTTPRAVPHTGMDYCDYVLAVLNAFSIYASKRNGAPRMLAKLILSVDRRHSPEIVEGIIDIAISQMRVRGTIVGIDLCGDPTAGKSVLLGPAFDKARRAGLKITIHLGEVRALLAIESQLATQHDDMKLRPDRIGHATYLSQATSQYILEHKVPIEICITSNIACKTVASVDCHHIKWAIEQDLPILICTDDPLIFKTSPLLEYTKALATCNQSVEVLYKIMMQSVSALFCTDNEKEWVKVKLSDWMQGHRSIVELQAARAKAIFADV